MARVLAVGDVHEPVSHPMYLRFCQDIYNAWQCDTVVFIGDLTDSHSISFHATHPECPGPKDEYLLTYQKIQKWYKVFPKAYVTLGNHDQRPTRLAESVNIPYKFLRNYSEIWETPGWNWVEDVEIDDVLYYHGIGHGGVNPAANAAKARLMSVCIGHAHSVAGVKWMAGPHTRIFGMDTGCGIDEDAFQFAYGKHMTKRPVLACGVVIDGLPYSEIMPCGRKEKYYRGKK